MRPMERVIRAIAGTFVTISVILGYYVSPYWFLFTLFVGLNLFQSSFTRWCLAEEILKKLGIATGDGQPKESKAKV
ncbi:MAG: DUF2892 domain-containing protein [Balneolaceae bacterium]|nr:DUF2892 domain-containing protein [Balneolaceae bacterium]